MPFSGTIIPVGSRCGLIEFKIYYKYHSQINTEIFKLSYPTKC